MDFSAGRSAEIEVNFKHVHEIEHKVPAGKAAESSP